MRSWAVVASLHKKLLADALQVCLLATTFVLRSRSSWDEEEEASMRGVASGKDV